MKIVGFFVAVMLSAGVATAQVPKFQEQARAAGIDHAYTGEWEFYVGGGVASFDCNNDRRADVALAGGQGAAALYVNRSEPGGDIRFDQAALPEITDASGIYPINLDADGITDLIVLRVGENLILKGAGNCQFEIANEVFDFDGGQEWTTGFAAIWEIGAAYPTLAFGNYVDRFDPDTPFGTCSPNVLIRPDAEGKYGNQTALAPGYCSLSILFTDWNNTGQFDLRVSNDRQYYRGGQEQMWALPPGQPPRLYGPDDGWGELIIWGMGISETDLNADGRPEYSITSMGDNMLQTLDNGGTDKPIYRDIAFRSGVTATRPYVGGDIKPSTAWHTQFSDVNNDARADLFIAKGNVKAMEMAALFDPDNLLIAGKAGQFTEVGDQAGIALDKQGRGAVVEDFNRDGKLDILVVNREENISLFRNVTEDLGGFVQIELANGGNGAVNPDAIGAKIALVSGGKKQTKTVAIGGGHASGQVGALHFGLAGAETAQVQIQWPDGAVSPLYDLAANTRVRIERGGSTAKILP